MAELAEQVPADGAHDVLPEPAPVHRRMEEEVEPCVPVIGMRLLMRLHETHDVVAELDHPAREVVSLELRSDVAGIAWRPPAGDPRLCADLDHEIDICVLQCPQGDPLTSKGWRLHRA